MAEPAVAIKGVLRNASMAGKCYNDDALFGETVVNMSVDDEKALSCDKALIWAKTTGITTHPEFYKNYTLHANSSYVDFQCALWHMKGDDEVGTGWNCSYPCTSTLPQCPPPVGDKDLGGVETTTAASSSSSSSLPLFAWILMGLALLGIIGGLAYYFLAMKKEAPKKKKRAVKKATPAPAPPAAPEPKVEATVPVITAPPVYVTQAMTAAPQAMTAAPLMMATPITTYSMATPTYAAPMVYPTSSVAVPTAMPAYSTMA